MNRYASDVAYRERAKERALRYYYSNREKVKSASSLYRRSHLTQNRKWQSDYKERNINAVRAYNRGYQKALYDVNKSLVLARSKAWVKKYPWKKAALNAKRRALELKATPPWANLEQIEAFYVEANKKTSETGVTHHVDHIYPLNGKTSTGLHVPWNLRVITASENLKKRNLSPEELQLI